MKARKLAFQALLRMETAKSYSNLTLDVLLKAENPEPRERQLAANLFYGVLERKLTLSYLIEKYTKKKLASLDPEVVVALELGLYQRKRGADQKIPEKECGRLCKRRAAELFAGWAPGGAAGRRYA